MKKFQIVLVVLILSGLALSVFRFLPNRRQVACTMDAKICPDGSAVGRVPPKCEFAPCPGSSGKVGTLSGKVTIAPLCPVEPCPEAQNPYLSRKVIVQTKSGGQILVDLDSEGKFQYQLDAGKYTLNLTDCNFLGRCKGILPKTVTVVPNETTKVQIDIDTGIR